MHTLTIIKNLFDQADNEVVQTDDVCATLQNRFAQFPHTARIYAGRIALENDVTPHSEADIEALSKMTGPFWVVVFPGDPGTLAYIAYALIAVVVIVAITNRPKVPNVTSRNYQSQSPNNALSGRTNQARVNGRIPDIFGTVRSTPDLLAVPYSIFQNHVEFEYCYMCIGRGTFAIDADTVRDGQTVSSKIEGESVEIFGPNTSPNTGDAPQLRIGTAITRPVISAVRSKSVNGQVLLAPNDDSATANNYSHKISFNAFGELGNNTGDGTDFTTVFHVGEVVQLNVSTYNAPVNWGSGGHLPWDFISGPQTVRFHADGTIEFLFEMGVTVFGPGGTLLEVFEMLGAIANNGTSDYDFSGKYTNQSYSGNSAVPHAPSQSNANWDAIPSAFGGVTPWITATFNSPDRAPINLSGVYTIGALTPILMSFVTPDVIRANNCWAWIHWYSAFGDRENFSSCTIGPYTGPATNWVGPFVFDVTTMNQIIANFVALNGMYKDDGSTQIATSVDLQLGATPCDAAGTATGAETFFTATVVGSGLSQSTRAVTLFADLPTVGRYMVRARRLTVKDTDFAGTVVDEVKWRDVYSSSPVGAVAFGDVTTVHAVTQATQTALAISERQMNMLVTRKVKQWNGSSFPATLVASNSADDILSHICLDPKIGNRQAAEVNFANFYAVIADALAYFGNALAKEFCYTFDNDNLSFEETISTIAQAVFCMAHRRGRVIEIQLEKLTPDSVLLFNHRNKVPGTETRTASFGMSNDNDGIEYDYVSPVDDAIVTFYLPEDRTAVNPKKIESVGVRSLTQAYIHAHREFNRLQYQVRAVTFDALQESELISINSRILVADNTRPDTQDGEVLAQDGFILTLSQPVAIVAGQAYVIFLQLPSGIVEAIACSYAANRNQVTLLGVPSEDLITADDAGVRTLYQIIKAADNNKGNNKAFLLTDKTPQSNFVNSLTAVNYDDRYYTNDIDFFTSTFRLLDTLTGTLGTQINDHVPDIKPAGFLWALQSALGLHLDGDGHLRGNDIEGDSSPWVSSGTSMAITPTFPFTVEFTARCTELVASGASWMYFSNLESGAFIALEVDRYNDTNCKIHAEVNDGLAVSWLSETFASAANLPHKLSIYMEADKFTFSIDDVVSEVYVAAFTPTVFNDLEMGVDTSGSGVDVGYIDKIDIRPGA